MDIPRGIHSFLSQSTQNSKSADLSTCETCAFFNICKECYGRIDRYHGHLRADDGSPHAFRIREGIKPEFLEHQHEEPLVQDEVGAAKPSKRKTSPRRRNIQTVALFSPSRFLKLRTRITRTAALMGRRMVVTYRMEEIMEST